MKKMLFGFVLLSLALMVSSCCCAVERIEHERNDNMYVKGFYGYGYDSQRHSHYDYVAQYYQSTNDDINDCWEEYCDSLEEYED